VAIFNEDEEKYHVYPDFQDFMSYEETTESAMNLQYIDEHEKTNELVRNKTNSGG
jgi:hypothetical protein